MLGGRYADERDTKKRGSSITDVAGCQLEKGMESWLLQEDKPKIVLKRADLQGGGSSSFAFASVELRDAFFEALANLAEGREWDESPGGVPAASRASSHSARTPVEWMWGDAGTDITRALARKNPLRWTSGTVATVADEMRAFAEPGKKSRPVDVRLKGTADFHSFQSQREALSWLQQVQRLSEEPEPELPERVDGTKPSEPEPELAIVPDLTAGDRYDSVCGTLDGPRTPPRIHGDPPPPSPAAAVDNLIRSASDDIREEIKHVVKRHGLIERVISGGGRMTDEPYVHTDDLDVTDEDRRHGFMDWHECAVNEAHLGAQGCEGFEAQGAKGYVRRALWKRCLKVAIKKADNGTWSGDGLTDEMRLFLDLSHPHIVACYGILKEPLAGSSQGSNALTENSIVTERCQTSLQAFLNDGSKWADLTPHEVDLQKYTILTHVSLGLQKLHDMSVLHRDIKCNNVLLDGQHTGRECENCKSAGRWKICDFGEAKVLTSGTGETDAKATISRNETDVSVTANSASPELLNGEGIGLPSDIYSFGILMWEVFARQEAWHWVTCTNRNDAITYQTLLENCRPKIPHGLSQNCAKQIRLCFNRNPLQRPTAREMTEWLDECRREKLMSLKVQGHKVSEREMLRRSGRIGVSIVDDAACTVCTKKCQHWSKAGRYSIHPTWLAKREFDGVEHMCFNLQLVAERIGKNGLNLSWTEQGLRDDYDSDEDPLEADPSSTLHGGDVGGSKDAKLQPLGIIFKGRDANSGKLEDMWPKVRELKSNQVAVQFSDYIQRGCRLLAVNDHIIDEKTKFKDAVPLIQKRPLTLCFSITDKWTDIRTAVGSHLSYVAAAAVQKGLECVGLVREADQSHASPTVMRSGDIHRVPTRLPSSSRDLTAEAASAAASQAAELSKLRDEKAQLCEQLVAQQTKLDEQQTKLNEMDKITEGLKMAMELVKAERVKGQAKDAEIKDLKARLQQFEGLPPV